jgi:glycerol uptake facilitator protein
MSQTTSSTLKGQCIAEFLGTGLLIFFGVGCVAALKLAGASFGQWEISIIWGLGVAMAIYLTAAISGAHLNPAVTIALMVVRLFRRTQSTPYIMCADRRSLLCSGTGLRVVLQPVRRLSSKPIIWYGAATKA